MVLALCLTASCVSVGPLPLEACGWVGIWASSQQLVEARNELPTEALADSTIRQTVRASVAGHRLRVRLSNEFGEGPLRIGAASLGLAPASGASSLVEGSVLPLTFDGHAGVTVPEGAAYYSDVVDFDVAAGEDMSVSLYVEQAPMRQSGHPGSRTTSHHIAGNAVSDVRLSDAEPIDHWYYLVSIETLMVAPAASVGAIGDSITDGRGSTTNGNDRWTDFLAARLAARNVSALNFGLGGNRVLKDGLGPNVLARIDRDILTQPNLKYVIVFEGINDIGTLALEPGMDAAAHDTLVADVTSAFRQVIDRAHAHGIKVYGATIGPYFGSSVYPNDNEPENDRQRINAWIRESGAFDAVLDFDAVLRDPARPDHLLAAYDSGDGLHPSPAGFKALADSIPIDLLETPVRCSP